MLERIERNTLKDRIFHLPEMRKFGDDAAVKQIFFDTPNTVGAITCAKPGQYLELHSHESADDIWFVLEGTADFYPNLTDYVEIKQGDVIFSKPGELHGMKNNSDENFVMLGIAGPTPIGFTTYKDKHNNIY